MEEMMPWDEAFDEDQVLITDSLTLTRMSLEEAGLEEDTRHAPSHGFQTVQQYVAWWSDGEDSRYEAN